MSLCRSLLRVKVQSRRLALAHFVLAERAANAAAALANLAAVAILAARSVLYARDLLMGPARVPLVVAALIRMGNVMDAPPPLCGARNVGAMFPG